MAYSPAQPDFRMRPKYNDETSEDLIASLEEQIRGF